MEFNWEDFKNGKIAVHCDTKDKATDFVNKCYEYGIRWLFKANDDITLWEEYENDTFYFGSSNSQMAILSYGNYEDAKDEIIFEWELTSSYPKLKEGMIVECRNKNKYLLRGVNDVLIGSSFDGWIKAIYNENLCENYYHDETFDIMKIYKSKSKNLENLFDNTCLTCIWERKESKKMTLAQISEALGYEVEVIDNE